MFAVNMFAVKSKAQRARVYGVLIGLTLFSLAACGPRPDAHAVENDAVEGSANHVVKPLTAVRVVTLVARSAVESSRLPGDILPFRQATVAAEVPGVVEAIRVQEGQRVKVGKVLAEIDVRGVTQRLREVEAVVKQRRIQFDKAKRLYERQTITQGQFLDATTARDVAEAQLSSVQLELDKARVAAPWSGTLARKLVEAGDYVQPGQPLFEILELDRLKIRAPAASKDVPFLQLGSEVTMHVEAFADQVFRGSVTRLASTLDSAARTLDVEVEIDNRQGLLRPGMYAQVEIPLRQWDDVVLLPLRSLVEMGDGRQVVYLFVSSSDDGRQGRIERRGIKLGPILGDSAVVLGGLEAGDRVLIEGQHQVTDGQDVQLLPQDVDSQDVGTQDLDAEAA